MKKNMPASAPRTAKQFWEIWQVLQYCIDLGKQHGIEPSELLEVYFNAYEEHRTRTGSIVPLLWQEDTEAYWNGQIERQEYQLERVRQRVKNKYRINSKNPHHPVTCGGKHLLLER